ncbi:WD40/YVTN/BNR-like repeat-containing protein [Chitinophaga lutea]
MSRMMLITACLALVTAAATAQSGPVIRPLTTSPITSIRGLSVVTDDIAWVSGTGGKAGRTLDGGKTWQWMSIPGCDTCDFRDVEAFSGDVAVVMAIATPARIYRTEDGGKHWQQTFYDNTPGMFLDGMAFWDADNGIAVGDPLKDGPREDFVVFLRTRDGGRSWESMDEGLRAKYFDAIFAASGTSIATLPDSNWVLVTGGSESRLNYKTPGSLSGHPIERHIEPKGSAGLFSVAFRNAEAGVTVGGDYMRPTETKFNCHRLTGKYLEKEAVQTPPRGYRSCVAYLDADRYICTGPTGTDISTDGGITWKAVKGEGYHVVQRAKTGSRVYFAGSKGRIAVLTDK